ncbi:MAG TPA: AAA family ATPase [Candidatus Saccharimonadales bacterium]|nr:AAA family ATPase [Candidatus Saccharimonadales bacterium]
MTKKIFLLGRSGSGKTTVASYIKDMLGDVFHSGDYLILHDMYMKDDGNLFEPADPFRPDLGFNIKNPMTSPVWDMALKKMEQETQLRIQRNEAIRKDEHIILEFARRDHIEALKQLSHGFLQNSYFLFVEASVPTAIERIHKRVENKGEHYIREAIISGYFGLDNYPFMEGCQILGQKVTCIRNEGLSEEELREKTNTFVESISPSYGKEGSITSPPEGYLPMSYRR